MGFVFITNVVAVDGALSIAMQPDGVAVKSVHANGYGTKATVTVLAETGAEDYKPVVTVNGGEVSLTRQANGDWTGSVVVWILGVAALLVQHEDGSSHSVPITTDTTTTSTTTTTTSGM